MLIQLLFQMSLAETNHNHHDHHEELHPQKGAYEETLFGVSGEWENQLGQTFKLQDLSGKPHLFAMLYTRCQTACPILVEDVKKVVTSLPPDQQDLRVVLFSIDSESETKASLDEFYRAKKMPSSWTVARANSKDVATLAAVLGVNFKRLPDGEYVHSNSIFFVDSKGNLIAQQDGLNKVDPQFVKKIQSSLSPTEKPSLFEKTKQYFKKLWGGSKEHHHHG